MTLPNRPVSDDLLRLTIESKIDAGAGPASIRELIEAFASYDQEPNQATEIVGFLGVEDIPDGRRGMFLMALLALAEDPATAAGIFAEKRRITPGPESRSRLFG